MPQYQGVWTLPVAARLQSTQQWATDPLFDYTTLLLQADNAPNGAQNNTFLDSSSNNYTITRNGNTTQGTFTPFSATGWSNYFDGSGDYLTVPNSSAFALPGDFTIELWVNFSSNTTSVFCGNINNAGAGDWALFYNNAFGIRFITDNTVTVVTGNYVFTPGVWTHVAVSRSGTNLRIFANGQVLTTVTNSSSNSFAGTMQIGRANDGTLQFPGYMSNLRIVKGTALYTSNFTPSPIPLTAITNTSLLTCQSNRFVDNSTNNFAITRFGDTSVQAFSPFAPQYQYTPSITGGSGYFDGTGDYLSTPDSTAFDFGTSSLTVEAWIYTGVKVDYQSIIGSYDGGSNGWYLHTNASGTITYGINAATPYTGTIQVCNNAWNHIAMVRNGSSALALYVNGVLDSSQTNSTNINNNAEVRIGSLSAGATRFFNGYISGVRVVNGTAVYTSAFTPPTAPLTAITNTQLLTNFTNAGIYDGTLKNNLETVGNAQVSTSVVKYGTGSMYFDGTGDWLQAPSASNQLFVFGTGDFTVECWFYRSSTSARGDLLGTYSASPTGWGLSTSLSSTADIVFYIGNTALASTSGSVWSVDTWTHVAVVRLNGNLRIYVNGVSQASVANTTNLVVGSPLQVGAAGNSTQAYNGYIDDLRITKGIARYTANFTPPSVALPRQ